ncbi:MAG TPA: hypothetical protein VGL35_06775 [Rhizomicrobium sp.]
MLFRSIRRMRPRRRAFLYAAALASVAVPVAAAFASPDDSRTCDGNWKTVRGRDVTRAYGDFNSLNAVAALASDDVWAVGQFRQFAGTDYDQTLAEHWNGTKWKVVPMPSPSLPLAVLAGVAATGPHDIWAVGYEQAVGQSYRTLIEHWDGNAWTIVEDGSNQGWLTSVVALGPSDVWAAGSTDYIGSGLVEHWDGHSWTPTLLADSVFLRGIAATTGNDIWVVGQHARNGDGDHTFAAHFDGTRWTRVPTPNPLRQNDIDQNWLTSVAALASDDVWAAGVTRDPDYGIPDHTLSEHWDGNAWQVVHTPHLHQRASDFWSIAALSTGLSAVGSTGSDPNFSPLSEAWNGTSWNHVKTPSSGSLLGLASIPANSELWAVGNRIKQNLYTGTLVEHLCSAKK